MGIPVRRSHHLALFTAAALCLLGLAYRSYASPELGLVARYVEELDGSPILAGIFDAQAKRTYEYGPGDYVKGLLVRQVLRDRVVLVDEVTKYQYVLVVNEVELDEEPGDVDVIRVKRRKRDLDDMDVTSDFNREMAKADGSFLLGGTATRRDADEAKGKADRKAEPLGGQLEETMQRSPLRDQRRQTPDGKNPFKDDAAPAEGDDKEGGGEPGIPSAVTPYRPPAPQPPAGGTRPSSPRATAPPTHPPAAPSGTTEVR